MVSAELSPPGTPQLVGDGLRARTIAEAAFS